MVAIVADVFGPRFQDGFHQGIFVGGGLFDVDVAFLVEHPGHTAVFPEVAAVFGEDVADVGHRPVLVVRQGLQQDGGAPRPVTFVGGLLVVDPLQLAGAFFDGTVDVVFGHVFGLGGRNGRAQPRIGVDVAAAHAGGNCNFLDQPGKDFSPFGIRGPLFVLDGRPLAVSGHNASCFLPIPMMKISLLALRLLWGLRIFS